MILSVSLHRRAEGSDRGNDLMRVVFACGDVQYISRRVLQQRGWA